nr:MAG: hypothetical protein [Tarsiger cyanurus parvoviridae sp.]
MPLGYKPHRSTRHYERSYTIYIKNGVGDMSWTQNAGAANALPSVTWNEGWQHIPWGQLPASITPHEWSILTKMAKRFRVLDLSVHVDSVIPFQENLVGGGTREAQTCFSNRPSLQFYQDDNELLPDINDDQLNLTQHNKNFTLPYGNQADCSLATATFTLLGMDTTLWDQTVANLPPQGQPQGILSLTNTGRVKPVYPGETYSSHWKNDNTGWRSARIPWDSRSGNTILTPQATALAYQQQVTNTIGQHYLAGATGQSQVLNAASEPGPITPEFKINNHGDTALPIKYTGPPNLLCRMEQYYGTNGEQIQIFAQAHIRYGCTIEIEEIEAMGTLGAYWGRAAASTANTPITFSRLNAYQATGFPNDNLIHRDFGVSVNNSLYT